ncbi:MAG: HU family DNA-binding protein [Parabacteroides sp.]|nr:HU family DNA-binding protein [Parabacteroides sp.]
MFSIHSGSPSERDPIVLKGFGTLSPREQNSRPARNPKTGEVVVIPKRLSVKFSVGKFLFEDLNK